MILTSIRQSCNLYISHFDLFSTILVVRLGVEALIDWLVGKENSDPFSDGNERILQTFCSIANNATVCEAAGTFLKENETLSMVLINLSEGVTGNLDVSNKLFSAVIAVAVAEIYNNGNCSITAFEFIKKGFYFLICSIFWLLPFTIVGTCFAIGSIVPAFLLLKYFGGIFNAFMPILAIYVITNVTAFNAMALPVIVLEKKLLAAIWRSWKILAGRRVQVGFALLGMVVVMKLLSTAIFLVVVSVSNIPHVASFISENLMSPLPAIHSTVIYMKLIGPAAGNMNVNSGGNQDGPQQGVNKKNS